MALQNVILLIGALIHCGRNLERECMSRVTEHYYQLELLGLPYPVKPPCTKSRMPQCARAISHPSLNGIEWEAGSFQLDG
jgi:hypothetical protein